MKLEPKKLSISLSLTALGLIIGSIVSLLKLPIFLDTIGIMLATLLLGWRYGVLCSVFTAVFAFFLVSPYVPFFILTMLGTVAFTEYARSKNMYSKIPSAIIVGVVHGVIGTLLSVPVTYFVFDGFTSTGNDVIVAYLNSLNINLFLSVFISLLIFAIIDRVLTCIFSHVVLRALPKSFYTKNDFRYFKN